MKKKWRLNKYTHEMVSPTGEIIARLRIGKNNQIAFDGGDSIEYSGGGSAIGYHIGYNIQGRSNFPSDDIVGELHYFTGKDYAGNTIRCVG